MKSPASNERISLMPTSKDPDALQLETVPQGGESSALAPSPINILESAIRGGVTQENVSVVKELIAMCREQRAEDAKAAFAKAFFQLRKNMPEIYADKEAKDRNGNITFCYCSEEEIAKKLDPHLLAYGFASLFGQEQVEGRVIIKYTLIHEQGHSETREFSVRSGAPNAMKDAAMCDTGAATTALRHLLMKLYGLKSRISDKQNAAIEGEKISPEKIHYLREQVRETGSSEARFLEMAGVKSLEEITEGIYPVMVRSLSMKAKK